MDQSVGRIVIRRHPYEEPYLTQLEWFVTNGSFSGTTNFFCNVDDIREMGEALNRFPTKLGDEYIYEYGPEKPEVRYCFSLRACTTDAVGHCALQFSINNNNNISLDGQCSFSIVAEAGAIQRLGSLLRRFGELQHLQLSWTPSESQLFESYEPLENESE